MKFKKTIHTLLLLTLTTQITAQAFGSEKIQTTKPTTCKKIGEKRVYQNKLYSCAKVNSKLLFVLEKPKSIPSSINNTIINETAKPTQTSNPANTGVDTQVNTATNQINDEVLNTFKVTYNEINDAINKSPAKLDDSRINYIIDPEADPRYINLMKEQLEKVVKYYDLYAPQINNFKLRVYAYNTKNFSILAKLLREDYQPIALEGGWFELKEEIAKREPEGFYGGGAAGYGKDNVPVLFYYFNKIDLNRADLRQAFGHELIHVYQRYLLGNMSKLTCWMREGGATYLGYQMGIPNSSEIESTWRTPLSINPDEPTTKNFKNMNENDWVNWLIEQEDKSVYTCDEYAGYVYGAFVWNYLYYTYGTDKATNFLIDTNKYTPTNPNSLPKPTDAWKESYEKTFGIKPQDDYINIAKYIIKYRDLAIKKGWVK